MTVACLLLLLTKSEIFAEDVFTYTLTEAGGNVVATGVGTIDLADLEFLGSVEVSGGINPGIAVVNLGPTSPTETNEYSGISGPQSFGTVSDFVDSSTGSGDAVGIAGYYPYIRTPIGYTSGSALSGVATFGDATFASLGITPGIYTYTYGSGADAGEIIVDAPEPSTWATMLGGGALLGFCVRRKLA